MLQYNMTHQILDNFRICPQCSKNFSPNPKSRVKQVYCSKKCKNSFIKRRYMVNHNLFSKFTKKCKKCGKDFETPYPKKIYCSETCSYSAKKIRKRSRQSCEVCGFSVPHGLHEHHTSPKKKRILGSSGEKLMLCANCHNILHHEIGWGSSFNEILTKEQSKDIIYRCYEENGVEVSRNAK